MKLEINRTRQKVASLVFAAVAVLLINYAVAQTSYTDLGHIASSIGPGTFAAGSYIFPSGSSLQVGGDLDVSGGLDVQGSLQVGGGIISTGGTAVYETNNAYCEIPGSLTTSSTCKTRSCGTGYNSNYQQVTCYYGCDGGVCTYIDQYIYINVCTYTAQQTCNNQLIGRLVANA